MTVDRFVAETPGIYEIELTCTINGQVHSEKATYLGDPRDPRAEHLTGRDLRYDNRVHQNSGNAIAWTRS